jgi:hypothetical protein
MEAEKWKGMVMRFLKRLHIRLYEILAVALIACIVISRFILAANNWPLSDSDEGTFGIEAMHIAFHGEHPVYMYGQTYLGVIESYLGALYFHLFGVSLFTLRLGMITIFTLFLIALYLLVRILYTKAFAIIALCFVGLGNDTMLLRQLKATGGGVETLLLGTVAILLTSWLALSGGQQRQQKRWRRYLAYLTWGLAVGLGLWSHILVAPFVLASGLILLVFCWREWRTWAIPCILIGFLIGGFPLIYYNLTVPLSQNSLAVAFSIQGGNDPWAGVVVGHPRFLQHIVGTFLYALPLATGSTSVCNLQALPIYGRQISPHTFFCSLNQGGWSLLYMALLLVAMAMAIVSLWQLHKERQSSRETWPEERRQAAVIHLAHLMLLFSGLLTILFYLASNLTAVKPWSVRYLIGLSIVLPALIWPLWHGLHHRFALPSWQPISLIARYALLLLFGVVLLAGTIMTFQEIPAVQAAHQNDMQLIHDLEQRGIDRFYSEYWTCYRLVFLSRERLICSVVTTSFKLAPLNRIPSYESIVAGDPKAAYVFPPDPFVKAADHDPAITEHYHRIMLDGYVIYMPD